MGLNLFIYLFCVFEEKFDIFKEQEVSTRYTYDSEVKPRKEVEIR
jgi:hypothetical protein